MYSFAFKKGHLYIFLLKLNKYKFIIIKKSLILFILNKYLINNNIFLLLKIKKYLFF